MRAIDWTDDMSVGLTVLDDDHKRLIAVINRLYNAEFAPAGRSQAEITFALQALSDYTEHHFAREEAVLRTVGYSNLAAHRAKHADFVTELHHIARSFELARDPAVVRELIEFLRDWLTHHILVEDMAYRPLVVGNGDARAAAERFTGRALPVSDRAR